VDQPVHAVGGGDSTSIVAATALLYARRGSSAAENGAGDFHRSFLHPSADDADARCGLCATKLEPYAAANFADGATDLAIRDLLEPKTAVPTYNLFCG
jgi:hypothetical protein